MPIEIKLNTAERIRRPLAADPSMSTDDLISKLGVTIGQIKAALAYSQRPGRKRA